MRLTLPRSHTTFAGLEADRDSHVEGNGNQPSFHTRSRGSMLRGAPVVMRLTRTMGFVEVSQSPGVPGSMGTPGEYVRRCPDALPASH